MSEILATYRVKTREEETDVEVAQIDDADGRERVRLTLPDRTDSWGVGASVDLDPGELGSLLQCLSLAGGYGDYDA